jgi:hypothetical protein
MRRSNKLLIGLLIALFITPLGLLMAFRKMVKEDPTLLYEIPTVGIFKVEKLGIIA